MYITKIKVIPMTSPHIINDCTAVLCTPLTCIIPLLLVVPNIVLYRGNVTTHVSVCLSVCNISVLWLLKLVGWLVGV